MKFGEGLEVFYTNNVERYSDIVLVESLGSFVRELSSLKSLFTSYTCKDSYFIYHVISDRA